MHTYFFSLLIVGMIIFSRPIFALSVVDDSGDTIKLDTPAQRIVTLAPHIVEQLYAIGAGDRIIGTVNYSDYPEAAKQIPIIGGYDRFDLEAIVALKPDLVIGWISGNNPQQIARLKELGLALFLDEPRKLNNIAVNMERLGILTGHPDTAQQVADKFRNELQHLRTRYQSDRRVSLFYQLWHQPLMTVNGEQIINDILTLCGGENIFQDLTGLTPVVSHEAVIAADPEIIITTGMHDARIESQREWKKWKSLRAVKNNNLYSIDPDIIHRASPRLLFGARQICEFIAEARAK